ncbi:MAG TPA: heme exporter protein CcmD [Stellaceae bacterium]|jgi:heme exporter protein D|nr:heme exporter protein CcmD [Stellaceae bacterium]
MAGLSHYLAMGGYAAFVWPAFAVAAAIMAGLAIQSLGNYRRRQRELARLERDDARRDRK